MRTFTKVCCGLSASWLGLSGLGCAASGADESPQEEAQSQVAGLRGSGHSVLGTSRHFASRHAGKCHHGGGSHGAGGSAGGSSDCALEILDGTLSSQCSALFGYFYTYVDDGYSSIAPSVYGPSTTGSVCAQGSAAQVLDEQYDVYWGAGVGVALNAEIDGVSTPYDAASEGVTGFAFNLTGAPVNGAIRFDVHVQGQDTIYCTPAFVYVQEGYNEVLLADLVDNCWEPGSTNPDPSQLANLQWQVVTNTASAFDYDFCISDLVALK